MAPDTNLLYCFRYPINYFYGAFGYFMKLENVKLHVD